jgi:hypothetical protein
MPTESEEVPRPLPDRPSLRHLKDRAKDLLAAGGAESLTDAQFRIARLYGFASWPKLKAHVDSLEEIGKLKRAIDSNDVDRVKTLMTRNPARCTARRWATARTGRSPGSPNAACRGNLPARRDWPWRSGCLKTAPTCTRAATGR